MSLMSRVRAPHDASLFAVVRLGACVTSRPFVCSPSLSLSLFVALPCPLGRGGATNRSSTATASAARTASSVATVPVGAGWSMQCAPSARRHCASDTPTTAAARGEASGRRLGNPTDAPGWAQCAGSAICPTMCAATPAATLPDSGLLRQYDGWHVRRCECVPHSDHDGTPV